MQYQKSRWRLEKEEQQRRQFWSSIMFMGLMILIVITAPLWK